MWNIREVQERFLDHCRIGRSLSPNTLKAYAIDISDFRLFTGDDVVIDAVGRDKLRDYARWLIDQRGLKEASVKRRMAVLKVLFRWLEREEVIEITPFHRFDFVVRLPRRLPRSISAEELRRLLEAIGSDDDSYFTLLLKLVVTLLFVTGLRIGELVSIKLTDLDQIEESIQVKGKGNRERRVYLVSSNLSNLLERFLVLRSRQTSHGVEELFLDPDGKPVTPQFIRRQLIKAAKRADLPRRVTPHVLRHAAATHLVEAGVDIRFVQKLLGHASIATTQIYTQVSDNSLKAALARADTLGRVKAGADN